MNKRLLNLILLFAFLLLSATAYSQAVSMTAATGGLAGAAQVSGTNDIAILGVQLTKAAGGGNTVTTLNVAMAPTPVGKFTTARLFRSTDATFDGVGTETEIATGTITATNISFTGSPLTNFEGATAAADDEYFFVVVNVDPTAPTGSTTTPSLASTGVILSSGTTTGSTINGAAYTMTAPQITIANVTNSLAPTPLIAGSTSQPVFGFSLTSTGTQNVSAITVNVSSTAVGKWGSYTLWQSDDNDFATAGNNTDAGGSFNASSGTTIVITGLNQSITTTTKYYFLTVNVDNAVNGGTATVQPSLPNTGITSTPATGTYTGSAAGPGAAYAFAPRLTVANLSTGLAADPLIAGSAGQAVFGFSLTSSSAQTVTTLNVQLTNTPTPGNKWTNYKVYRSTDADYSTLGNNTEITTAVITPSSNQLQIGSLTEAITTTGTNYFLVVDINPAVTGATSTIQPSLAPGNVTITTGGGIASGTATGTNYSFGVATATFAQLTTGIAPSPLSAGTTNQAILGFSASSNASQTLSALTVLVSSTPLPKWAAYSLVRSTDASFTTTGDNTTIGSLTITPSATQITITGLNETLNSTAKNYFLVVTVDQGVTAATPQILPSFTEADITVTGNKNAVTVTGTNYSFNTSQSSDIILNGSTTASITYQDFQADPISGFPTGSTNLGDYIIRDGGGVDGDNKATTVTSISLEVTHAENLRRIVLYDDSDDTEIAGTQQLVTGTGTVTIVFNPDSPIIVPDGGTFEFKVRASFEEVVTDKHAIQVSVTSVTASAGGSGFSPIGTWGPATQTANNTNVIAVVATKYIVIPSPTTQAISSPITITVQAVDDEFENRDLDFTGTITLQRSPTGTGTFTATQGFTQALVAGQFVWTDVQFSASNTYTVTANDNIHVNLLENGSVSIVITASSSTIGQPSALNLCYGGSFQTLGNITITETDAAGFSNSGSFSIALPTGYVFDTGTNPTLTMSNSTTAFSAVGFTGDNIVQFTYNIASPTGLNTLTIANLRIRYPGNTAPSGGNQITRSGGTAVIAGVGAGTQLGTVNAALGVPPGTLGFTVQALAGDVAVDPNQTNFSINGNAVQLVGTPSGGTFSGSGITLVSGNYRFNPASLSAGTYPITYTYTNPSGQNCQFTFSKNFVVYSSGINNLGPLYCSNDDPTGIFSVDGTFLNSIGPNLEVTRYVYYDFDNFTWINITNPSSNPASTVFDPELAEYKPFYNKGLAYGYPVGLIIGFYVRNTVTLIESFGRWQVVEVRPAPTVTFTTSSNTYTFCEDNPPVTLIGSPANSNNITLDRFDAGGTGVAAVTHSIVAGKEVWSFSPAAVTGVGPTTPQTFSITYKYTDPVTACDATSTQSFKVKDRPSRVDPDDITDNPFTVPHTSIELCQGGVIGSFSAPSLGSPLNAFYTWYSDIALTSAKGRGNSFTPPIDNTVPQNTKFYVTQTTQREAVIFFGNEIVIFEGCESDKGSSPNPLELTVVVNPTPAAPTIADATLDYCIGQTIPDLAVTGLNVRWYKGDGTFIIQDNSPTALELGIDNMIAKEHQFYATQTANGCEGTIPASATFVTVTVKPLPVVSIIPDNFDPMRICKTDDPRTFKVFDGASPALQPPGTISWSGVSAIVPDPGAGVATLNPSVASLTPGNYTLTVSYTTAGTNCSNTANLGLRVMPTVNPSFTVGIACDSLPVKLVNKSKMVPLATTSYISSISWSFGVSGNVPQGPPDSFDDPIPAESNNNGKTTGRYDSLHHLFNGAGSHEISYVLTTSDGCVIKPPSQNITVNRKPQISFTWEKPCLVTSSGLSATKFKAVENSVPTQTIDTYQWNFRVGSTLNHIGSPGGAQPEVNYTNIGTDIVQLIAITGSNCRDTLRKVVHILPTYTAVTKETGYQQNFNSGDGSWIQGGVKSSWAWGNTVDGSITSDGQAWATNLTGPNNDGEESWVMSGCFNVFKTEKPVISLDIWSETPSGVDGAVLQYNKDGAIEKNGSWKVLGEVGTGINWYDGQGISNSPGNQTTSDYGWTGVYADWKNAIYKLDDVKPGEEGEPDEFDSLVVFRVAFAGGNRRQSGFAFDNIFIGERSRVVLLENFTNSSPTSTHSIGNYENFPSVANTKELIKIQYHTAFPFSDPLNDLSKQMHNARTAFYGITQVPTVRIDGDFQTQLINTWNQRMYDDRVLTPAAIKLNVTAVNVGGVVKINTSVENTGSETIEAGAEKLHIFTVIIDSLVTDMLGNSGKTQFINVAKQMLPSPAGHPINQDILPGAANAYHAGELTWNQNNGNKVVVFVQKIDGNNKEVYQAAIVKPVGGSPTVVTGTEDPEYAERIYLFPNPANQEVNIQLPAAVNKPTPVIMVDAFGRIVYQSVFQAGERTKTVSTSTFADGIYMLQLAAPQGSKVVKKVMVTHR